MASKLGCGRLWQFYMIRNVRFVHSQPVKPAINKRYTTITLTALSAVAGYVTYQAITSRTIAARQPDAQSVDKDSNDEKKVPSANQREITFLNFASVEYEGNVYMTPQDFLDSITEDKPRPRSVRRHIRQNEVEKFLKNTPSKSKGSPHFFRDLLNKGLISYTEYLFLLCVLTKPRSGFQIAFNMFDTDGDQRVDKKEFLVLERLMANSGGSMETNRARMILELRDLLSSRPSQHLDSSDRSNIWSLVKKLDVLMDVYNHGLKHSFRKLDIKTTEAVSQRSTRVNIWNLIRSSSTDDGTVADIPTETTLTVHFFGTKGKDVLTYQDFHRYEGVSFRNVDQGLMKYRFYFANDAVRFMDNLQSEVLELEFNEFSHGMPTIHEQDFARILLRYTILTKEAHEEYLDRLAKRIPHSQGITFVDFKEFCQFLNNVDDFALAMRMYTYADQPISEAEFQRAVKACTGQSLNSHLIHVVFQLFDADGDKKLSHKEFIAVMKERLHRRTRQVGQQGWMDNFKTCVKNEMRSA